MKECYLCPRHCGASRNFQAGYCKVPSDLVISRAALHFFEEPSISGANGSGTIFFSGCNLGCVYCQNYEISNGKAGKIVDVVRLSQIMMELQEKGAHNINLVTPTHYVDKIKDAIVIARSNGLHLPIVYNSSGYDDLESLKLLDGLIDVYMPDLKYYSRAVSYRYSNAKNYFDIATMAIEEMFKQVGKNEFQNNLMTKGVLVRHLILPGYISDSKKILLYLREKYKDSIYISIMSQYTPIHNLLGKYKEIDRKVTQDEYQEVIDFAINIGIKNAYMQVGDTAKESFIPNFKDNEGV